jgi:hypothetical protein
MTRFQDHLSDPAYSSAIRTKLGDALRDQYDLMEPVPPSLVELLAQLNTSVRHREARAAKLYAEFDECVSALVSAANRQPREPEDETLKLVQAKLPTPVGCRRSKSVK